MAKKTLKAMEAELSEWGNVSSEMVAGKHYYDEKFIVCDDNSNEIASGFERRDVLEKAYAIMQERSKQAPAIEAPQEASTQEAIDREADMVGRASIWQAMAEMEEGEPIAEIPCVLSDKNAELESLRSQLNVMELDRDDWEQSCISANRRFEANDAATKENFTLRKELEKSQADFAAAQAIIVQAGETVTRLKKFALDTIMGVSMSNYPQDLLEEIKQASVTVGLSMGVISDIAERYVERMIEPAQAPVADSVTLTESEITWLLNEDKLVGMAWQFDKLKSFNVGANGKTWELNSKFNTEANRNAIAARRAQLEAKS